MSRETIEDVLAFLEASGVPTLDLTGGAPELNPHFRDARGACRELGVHVMDRCNLTILEQPGQEDLAEFLAREVEVVASLPCYLEDNVDRQRGKGVFEASITGLQALNALGYGEPAAARAQPRLQPAGPRAAARAGRARSAITAITSGGYGITFNRLYVLTNMPIQRFGSMLDLEGSVRRVPGVAEKRLPAANLENVMCRSLVSIDWRGYVYDCDFNQMLELPLAWTDVRARTCATCGTPISRQSDRRGRSLLRLHRRPGLELRRRARLDCGGKPLGKKLLVAAALVAVASFFSRSAWTAIFRSTISRRSAPRSMRTWQPHPSAALRFFLIYVVVTGLSLPGAAVMTLIAGALFGVLWGTLIVSFASSIGATLAFLASRFVLRDWVQAKFGDKLKAINAGIAKEGPFYSSLCASCPRFRFSRSISRWA